MDHLVINLSVYFILFYYFMYSFGSARHIVPKKKIIVVEEAGVSGEIHRPAASG
jgi:hypothetical protein